MVKRRIITIALLLCTCFFLLPCHMGAASTADATEWISPETSCNLNIYYGYAEKDFWGVPVKLYKIADVSADFIYTLTDSFADSGLVLNGVQTNGEWKVIRTTLEAYILSRGIDADVTAFTDSNGQALFENLETGLYLAVATPTVQDGYHCYFDTSLIALPGLGVDGTWNYDVNVNAKGMIVPPTEPDNDDPEDEEDEKSIELKVIKLWRGEDGSHSRPETVEVDIFKNGELYRTVSLSEENNWSYSWTEKDDGSRWMVAERNVPSGYVMTVEEKDTSFILTNVFVPDDPDIPDEPPETGDTSNILLYVILMIVSGSVLIIWGITGKRKGYEETN